MTTPEHSGPVVRPYADTGKAAVRELFITVNRALAPERMRGAFEDYIERALRDEIDIFPEY